MIGPMKKKENIHEEWLVLFVFVSKLFNPYYLIVGEESVGKNVMDDV